VIVLWNSVESCKRGWAMVGDKRYCLRTFLTALYIIYHNSQYLEAS